MDDIGMEASLGAKPENFNAVMGEAHKQWIADRMSDATDSLTQWVAEAVGIHTLKSSCALRGAEAKEQAATKGELIVMLEGEGEKTKTVSLMAKSCRGIGSANQLYLGWLANVLCPADLATPAGQALTAILGSANGTDVPTVPLKLSALMSSRFKDLGKPLQEWLGDPCNLSKILHKILALNQNSKPDSSDASCDAHLILITMRELGPGGEDLHLLLNRKVLSDWVLHTAIKKNTKGISYVPIGSNSQESIQLSNAILLKRNGGDATNKAARYLQARLSIAGTLHCGLKEDLPVFLGFEKQRPESSAILALGADAENNYNTKTQILINEAFTKATDLDI